MLVFFVNLKILLNVAMMFYDILLTLDREVEKIWKKKFSGLTVLWFLVSINIPSSLSIIILILILK